jgi:hypothetical protein
MRSHVLLALAAAGALACRPQQPPQMPPTAPPSVPQAPGGAADAGPAAPGAAEILPPDPVIDLAPEGTAGPGRALVIEAGQERWLDAIEATKAGYTLVDLSDDWTPYIFAEHPAMTTGEPLHNRYRRVFVGLANGVLDEDGQPLPVGQVRHLELFGIPPSLSVLHARFLESAAAPCPAIDPGTLRGPGRKAVMRAAQRLVCERFLAASGSGSLRTGMIDEPMRHALRRFQHKHMIYEGTALQRRTKEMLARTSLENDHAALLRVLRERVVSAASVIEDGSAENATFRDAAGVRHPVPNLADTYAHLAAEQLGVATVEGALAFFQRRGAGDFARFLVAVKLPPRPEYYDHKPGGLMDLSIVIHRGDVWYDPPFDDLGAFKYQPRKQFPRLTFYVKHRGERVALARWRTTIGGWRAEQASDGYEYFRYKGSDVGPRVVRQVIAGPVWIAPASTPLRSLVKSKLVASRWAPVVNYDELGPGYLSAYGLVAGYFVTPGINGRPDFDNGIRAHGSAEYLSIYSANGYSHGCHRLPNHLAIRLYSFILRHRPMRVMGDMSSDYGRQFLWKDEVYEVRIPSRGYGYVLDPPLPVEVLEGNIRGTLKTPILTYVPKPGVTYPGPPPPVPVGPESRAGGAPAEEAQAQ